MPSLLMYFGLCWFCLRLQYGILSFPLLFQHFLLISLSRPSACKHQSPDFPQFSCLSHYSEVFLHFLFFSSSPFNPPRAAHGRFLTSQGAIELLGFLSRQFSFPALEIQAHYYAKRKKRSSILTAKVSSRIKTSTPPRKLQPSVWFLCVIPSHFVWSTFLLFNRANTYIEQKAL